MKLFSKIAALGKREVAGIFIPCLLISFGLWYITKLSYTYTATIPMVVRIEGQRIKVSCKAEATGYRLFAHRYILRKAIDLKLSDVDALPSVVGKDSYVIDPFTLQNIISRHNSDLRVISVAEIPEIVVKKE